MEENTRTNLNNLGSTDRELQNQVFFYILRRRTSPSIGYRIYGMNWWQAYAIQTIMFEQFHIRCYYDIPQSLRNLDAAVGDEKIREQSLALIETKTDLKYRQEGHQSAERLITIRTEPGGTTESDLSLLSTVLSKRQIFNVWLFGR